MAISVRPAVAADFPAIIPLIKQMHSEHAAARPDRFLLEGPTYTKKDFAKALRDSSQTWLVAVDESDQMLGYALCARSKWNASILCTDEICVDKAHRRQGIGTLLMDAAKELASRIGASSLELEVWEATPAPIQFYECYGMTVQRRRMELPISKQGCDE